MSVFKNIGISERFIAQLRLETFNTFNHTNLGRADSNVTDGTSFGTINSARIPGRIVQLGAKIIF
jgi:hypothetical protein